MQDDDDLTVDPLFVGLTRPATVLGIPYGAFIVLVLVVAIIFLIVGNPLYLLLAAPIYSVLYLLSAHDPGVFASMWLWMNTLGKCRNQKFWGSASFSPLSVEKWRKD